MVCVFRATEKCQKKIFKCFMELRLFQSWATGIYQLPCHLTLLKIGLFFKMEAHSLSPHPTNIFNTQELLTGDAGEYVQHCAKVLS